MPVVTEEQIQAAAQISRAVAAQAQANPMERLLRDVLRLAGENINYEQAVLSVAASEVVASLEPLLELFTSQISPFSGTQQAQNQELEQIRERVAFLRLLPLLAQTHFGQYVAIHDGRMVDSDRSQRALVRRFSEQFGDTSLYVAFVGNPPVARVPTPFFRRP
jgi:hypothetical protein